MIRKPQPNYFYLVYSPQGSAPRVPHQSHQSALSEAHRLAKRNPGQHFYVMRSASKAISRPVEVEASAQPRKAVVNG